MVKEQKPIISYEICKKDLKRLVKRDLLSDSVYWALLILILIFSGIYLLGQAFFFGICTMLACAVILFILVYQLIRNIIRLRLVEGNQFSIEKDTVSRLSKGEFQRWRRHTVDVLYFAVNGRYLPSKTVFDFSSVGDEFYVVVLHTKKDELCFAFHTMMYEYKDIG